MNQPNTATLPPSLPASTIAAARDLLSAIGKAEGDAASISLELRKFASTFATPTAAIAALAAVLLVEHATELDVTDTVNSDPHKAADHRPHSRVVMLP